MKTRLDLAMEMRDILRQVAHGDISTGTAIDDLFELFTEPWVRAVLDQIPTWQEREP